MTDRKRLWTTVLLFWLFVPLPVLFLLSIGPATYCRSRGWISKELLNVACEPVTRLRYAFHPDGRFYSDYIAWWRVLGAQHGGRTISPPMTRRRVGAFRSRTKIVSGPLAPSRLPPLPSP